MTSHETGSTVSGDVTLFYRRFGTPGKTPVLILHGLSYFSYDWVGPASDLAADREVVAADLRGFGDSSWSPERDYKLPTFAADVVALLDHLHWPKAVLLGHSFGGRIALAAASWNAERAAGLVCVDFAPDVDKAGRMAVAERIGNQPDTFASVAEALAYHGEDRDASPDSPIYKRYEAFLRFDGEGYVLKRDLHFRDNFRKVLETGQPTPIKADLWGMLSGLAIPTLVLRGTQSNMFMPETAEKCRQAGAHVSVEELVGGHNIAGDNPREFVRVVASFLKTIP